MTDPIGALRARVLIESPQRSEDNLGGAAIGWANEGQAWAEISALASGQAAAFDAAPSLSSLRVFINRRADVRAGWRVVWGGRVLTILGVRDDGAPRIELVCQEEIL